MGQSWLILGFPRGDGELGQFGRIYFGNTCCPDDGDVKKREESRRTTPGVWIKKLCSDREKADFRGGSSKYVSDIWSMQCGHYPATGCRSRRLDEWMSWCEVRSGPQLRKSWLTG